MKKRGLFVIVIGIFLVLISFGIAFDAFSNSNPTFDDEFFISNLLADIFDQVTDESLVYPGESVIFTYYSQNANVPLLWGLQITDYQIGDQTQIDVSNIFGDDLRTIVNREPVVFDMFVAENVDTYDFKVENTGERSVNVMMMFVEDPSNTDVLIDPDSPLTNLFLSLAISGIFLILGISVMLVGIVIFVLDWKKERNRSSYY